MSTDKRVGLLALVLLITGCRHDYVNYIVDWEAVEQSVSSMEIPWQYLFYTVYQDGVPIAETTSAFHKGRLTTNCSNFYVTATRTDLESWIESEPSEEVTLCRTS